MMIFRMFATVVVAASSLTLSAADIVWYDGSHPITYNIDGKTAPVVQIAVDMFRSDMEAVTGQTPLAHKDGTLQLVELDKATATVKNRLMTQGFDTEMLLSTLDAFEIRVVDGKIVIAGNNGRGTAYGLLEMSRMAGVSPWIWWGDVRPEPQSRLTVEADFHTWQSPSVEYRGIFLNDEDWSTRPWSYLTFEKSDLKGNIGPQTYKKIFQLLLRLRANAIWPGMHEGTPGFFTVAGNKQMADSCGIVVGTSHCEPLLRNNVAEWNHKTRGAYNYITNRRQVQNYWIERLKEVRGSEFLFTIGMRGIHDGSMEGVKTLQEKTDGLQMVIDDQREMLRKYIDKNVERVPQVFIPYKEVLQILENGLKVPDDVMLMWCDDNYGYMTRLADSAQQQRKGGGGVYYHLSYWGRPHDYLWLTTTQPGLIYNEMKAAYDHNVRRLWIANVHDPKVAAYDLSLFLDMAWNINSVSPSTITSHLEGWLCQQFGSDAGRNLLPVMTEYYRLNGIRKPEFMGWTQTELDKKKYPRGLSTVDSIGMTRAEAMTRLSDFAAIEGRVSAIATMIRPELRDAYFAAVEYPVKASAAMNRKLLCDSAESHRAYLEIQQLTARYNSMNGGKWRHIMDAAPRQLPVFSDVHGRLSSERHETVIFRNACEFTSATHGAVAIQMLGHSMNAVSLPKGGELRYEFVSDREGSATLVTALVPTQPNDTGDLRYSVSLDGAAPRVYSLKEKYRSETWKQNVLRGQAIRQMPIQLSKGKHTLVVKALDDHVVVDQWKIEE